MEISEPSIGIFYMSKMLALAPYAISRNSTSKVVIRRSWIFTIYSATVTVILVCLTYWGLLFDANSEIPVRIYRRSFTDLFVVFVPIAKDVSLKIALLMKPIFHA